ncbi:transposase [filamentous cyanobacterium LEGE 07170]|nr:transposase [filamentous cyanobacterium LEGE 07170]
MPNQPVEAKTYWPECPNSRTLLRWLQVIKAEGDLGDKRGRHRKGSGQIDTDPAIREIIHGAIKYLGPTASDIRLLKIPDVKALGLSRGALRNYLCKLQEENRALWLKLTNPAAYRNSGAVKFGSRSSKDLLPNAIWELDFTRNDLVLELGGKRHRFSIGGLIDVATRRRLFVLSTAPRGMATADLLIKGIRAWGMPHLVRPDNGKEFINHRILNFSAALGFTVDPCRPGHPEGKPHIERLFGDLNHDKIPLLPSYVGHNVASRQAIRENKGERQLIDLAMDWQEFETWLEAWRAESENEFHSSLGCSPLEQLAHFEANGWSRTDCQYSLDYLQKMALDRQLKTVNSYGIRHQNRRYIAAELGGYVGQKLPCLLDHQDPRHLWVMDADGKAILCEAKWEVDLTDEQMILVSQQAKRAARGIQEQGIAAGKTARQISKKLEKDSLSVFDPSLQGQAETALQQSAEKVTEIFGQATQGKLADPDSGVLPMPYRNPIQGSTPAPFGQDALDNESQAFRDDAMRLWHKPRADWTEQEEAFVREHFDFFEGLLAFSGSAADGVVDFINQLAA